MRDDTLYADYVAYHTVYEDGPDGHRLWRSRAGHLFIFDRSGDDPLDCDSPPARIPPMNGKIDCYEDGMRVVTYTGGDIRITSTLAAYLVNERDYRLTLPKPSVDELPWGDRND